MPNTLSVYDPIFYANEALIQLEKALGLAGRVHRGYDATPQQRGSTISIPKPGTFTAADMPVSASDLDTGSIDINLNKWKGITFALTDKELSHTKERIITDHIRPAAYAIADQVDLDVAALYADIPWYRDLNATPSAEDLTEMYRVLFENKVPLNDPNMVHMMVDGTLGSKFKQLNIFYDAGVAGQANNNQTLLRGSLGTRFGMEIFENQNTPSHTKGTASTGDLLLNGGGDAVAKGTSTINLDAAAVTGTLVPGDTFVIAGNTQRYSVTNTVTASGNAFTGVTITPALVQDYDDDSEVTVSLDDHTANIAFHRNAFALATAPLTDLGNQLGARIETVSDPITNLSIRSRLWYEGSNAKVFVGLDILYGVKTLDPNLAARLRG